MSNTVTITDTETNTVRTVEIIEEAQSFAQLEAMIAASDNDLRERVECSKYAHLATLVKIVECPALAAHIPGAAVKALATVGFYKAGKVTDLGRDAVEFMFARPTTYAARCF